MGKKNFDVERDKYQKIFKENKELKQALAIAKSELERAKKPCKCQKPEKEYSPPTRQERPQEKIPKRVEAVQEIANGDCPVCSGITIKAEYTKMGIHMVLTRCTEPKCTFRMNVRKE